MVVWDVAEKKAKSLTYVFRFRKLNSNPPVEVARGTITTVCITNEQGRMKATAIPKAVADRIEVAPKELLLA